MEYTGSKDKPGCSIPTIFNNYCKMDYTYLKVHETYTLLFLWMPVGVSIKYEGSSTYEAVDKVDWIESEGWASSLRIAYFNSKDIIPPTIDKIKITYDLLGGTPQKTIIFQYYSDSNTFTAIDEY